MPHSTMTIALDGVVTLDNFAQSMIRFRGLVQALEAEISPAAHIDWILEHLQSGSALATVSGRSSTMEAVEPIPVAFLAVGRALAAGQPVPYSPRVAKEARGLLGMLDGRITSIRFETQEDDATIVNPGTQGRRSPLNTAYGAVEGRVQTLTSRDSLRFTLYDAVHDRAVSSYLEEGRQDLMRNAWDRRAIVEGLVSRDSATGRPVAVRHVRNVTLIDDVVPGAAIRAARGIAPITADQPAATQVVRWLRDG